jgi:hypothetical protein
MRFTFPPYGKKIEAVSLQNIYITKIPRCKVTAIYMGFKEPIRCFDMQKISFYKSPGDLNCGRVGEAHLVNFSPKFSAA